MKPDHTTKGARALDRALDLFVRIVEDEGHSSLGILADEAGLPISTAHRMLARFEARGLLVRVARGRYRAGLEVARLNAHAAVRPMLTQLARPLMRQLASESARTLHLGILEADMVTYAVKETGGTTTIFTREEMQLEAYCSAIGKILLANLPSQELEIYLANGPFVALTSNTMTDPDELRDHFADVRRQGFAIDNFEVDDNVWCMAVPIRDLRGKVLAAISSSGSTKLSQRDQDDLLARIRSVAATLQGRLRSPMRRAHDTTPPRP